MRRHNIAHALTLTEARVADLQRASAHSRSPASPRHPHSHRRRRRALALGLGAIAVLAPASAFALPTADVDTPPHAHLTAVHHHRTPATTRPSITFTNPLDRSRGPGAGAGLL